jgi:hypothetical protein
MELDRDFAQRTRGALAARIISVDQCSVFMTTLRIIWSAVRSCRRLQDSKLNSRLTFFRCRRAVVMGLISGPHRCC